MRSTRMYDEIFGCINIASQELNRNFILNHSLTISVKKKGIRSNEDDWNVKVNGRRTTDAFGDNRQPRPLVRMRNTRLRCPVQYNKCLELSDKLLIIL